MKIIFPEINNKKISEAILKSEGIEAIPAEGLEEACTLLKSGSADAMIAGIEYSSRDVILACKNFLGVKEKTFSSSIIFTKNSTPKFIVADIATCKHPTAEQLFDIIYQTYVTARNFFPIPRIAILSFSTKRSGGVDDTIDMAETVIKRIKLEHPEVVIDGEMQLDAAIVSEVAKKKCPNSPVAGRANVLICPDINSGNILYKSLEYFGGYTAAGPILQGFSAPVSDLSRGSSVEDIIQTIESIKKLAK